MIGLEAPGQPVGTFPFGKKATERPARPAVGGPAKVLVLGVYPSALHVTWRGSDKAVRVQSLAVDDEPEVFWDGADAAERVERWKEQIGWQSSWGTATSSSNNGISGRGVLQDVLEPLGIEPAEACFTDCYRRYLVKTGKGSQGAAIERSYEPFASAHRLPMTSLPFYPSTDPAFVCLALAEDGGHVQEQLQNSGAGLVVTLGQPAADVLSRLLGVEPVVLRRDSTYGAERDISDGGRELTWLALKHPGQRWLEWKAHHEAWANGR